jgi:hypothetical protein
VNRGGHNSSGNVGGEDHGGKEGMVGGVEEHVVVVAGFRVM